MITADELLQLENLIKLRDIDRGRANLLDFTRYTFPKFDSTPFHVIYYRLLDMFAHGLIKRLIVTMPPQHGKSQGSTRQLPAYLFGIDPDRRVAVASYNATFARKFNRDIQRIIDDQKYRDLFPKTMLNSSNVVTVNHSYLRNADEFEIVNHTGSLKAVGRGGPLTGNPVDVMLMDDLYKDYAEGNSPVTRDAVWDWYTSVVKTRLHNDSQELMTFTRWHEDDLIGRLERTELVVTVNSWEDVFNAPPDAFIKINFEAIKTSEKTEFDPREKNEPLYPKKHSLKKLNADRGVDTVKFDALYQGDPTSVAGLLYGKNWKTYTKLPDFVTRKNYTDTADTGIDFLCSIDYGVGHDSLAYLLDVRYTDAPMEVTEPETAAGLIKSGVNYSDIESNAGGRSFGRKIKENTMGKVYINWFHQSNNKESRIISNAATVMQKIIMPDDWHIRWPVFYDHVTRFKRNFKANKQDGGPDVLTGITEKMHLIPSGSQFVEYNTL